MNSQQELLEAINAIKGKDKSFDTPATVLRVEGDTVWVHIDGGADETPVRRTINCEQGETVQVRISSGSAFLVGNASAPPTDDKTANVAHFIAEQADEKATKAVRSVEAISQTVEGKVASGDSGITDLSSTMYQNAYGVNIYNDALAVGDSYTHIDGDSFDIKEITTAGVIDDTNDRVVARFGKTESFLRFYYDVYDEYQYLDFGSSHIRLGTYNYDMDMDSGWNIQGGMIESFNTIPGGISLDSDHNRVQIYGGGLSGHFIELADGDVNISGDVYDYNMGYKKTPTILTSSTISAATTSYTFSDASITADSVIDVYDSIFGFAPTGISVSTGSCTVTFPAQSSSHQIKLFVY